MGSQVSGNFNTSTSSDSDEHNDDRGGQNGHDNDGDTDDLFDFEPNPPDALRSKADYTTM